MIKYIMNIGCACEGFKFAQVMNAQVQGPVDGLCGYDFKSTLDVFNGKLFDAMLNDKIESKLQFDPASWDEDGYFRYYCNRPDTEWNWYSIHHNFELPHRKEVLKKRINNFYDFGENLHLDSYYSYAISEGDSKLSEDTFNYVIDNLPKYVIDKLIIISGVRFKIPELFYNRFKCIQYNLDFNFTNEALSKLAGDWVFGCL